ncbi:hypothetical protein WR25_04393 [Diploscapter pachys]|uniref:Uncharacterized protein n=1 Tax=Diploscapter pachys TaxID=2018661 RepID=A0A2A2KCZ0_9BILA|nr:hypothetical protein WR25_04393 [Diploscapter pachys]
MGGPIVASYDLNMLQLFYYCNSEYQCEQIKSSQSQFRQLSKSHGHMRKLGCSEYSLMQHMQLSSRVCWNDLQYTVNILTKVEPQTCNNVYKHTRMAVYRHTRMAVSVYRHTRMAVSVYRHTRMAVYRHTRMALHNALVALVLSTVNAISVLILLSLGTKQLRTAGTYAQPAIYQGSTAYRKG